MSTSTFRTAVVRTPGGPDSIEIIDVPVVEPGPGEVRVEIAAAPVNPVDLAVAAGVFHGMGLINQPERTGLGWDFAGTVVATGPGVDLAIGTRVAGMVDGFDRDFGTYAEQLVVPAARRRRRARRAGPGRGVDGAAQRAGRRADRRPARRRAHRRQPAAGDRGGRRGRRIRRPARAGPRLAGDGSGQSRRTRSSSAASAPTSPHTPSRAGTRSPTAAALQEQGLALVRDGGAFVGVQPSAEPAAERGITVSAVVAHPDGARLAELLDRTASGELPARVHAVVPLDQVADAHRAVAKGGVRGRYVLKP